MPDVSAPEESHDSTPRQDFGRQKVARAQCSRGYLRNPILEEMDRHIPRAAAGRRRSRNCPSEGPESGSAQAVRIRITPKTLMMARFYHAWPRHRPRPATLILRSGMYNHARRESAACYARGVPGITP